jgi:alkanesulfonate monooxygenase SsuD/methylene tetrahydromethanopterin reductase-like flavin-dependent oxidoreductase (luciferase family)
VIEGRASPYQDARQTVRQWRAPGNAHHYTLRELAIHLLSRTVFIGTPRQVAERIDSFVQSDGSDGFIIGSHLTLAGLDEFADRVVPPLQERGSLRADYTGTTLRDNLGTLVAGPAASATVA